MGDVREVLEKLQDLDAGKLLALVDAFPGQRAGLDAVLRGEERIILEKIIRKLLDKSGRCIPAHLGITASVCDENRGFHVELPKLSYAEIRERTAGFFPGTEVASANKFVDVAEVLRAKYDSHELVGNFFQRARPIVLPKCDARENYGSLMQNFILPAVERAYKDQFPKRKFTNYRKGELDGKIAIISDTGHEELVSLMAEESVVAWYSPNPLQGFSIFAQREAMKILMRHGGFALAGGVDTGTAVVAYTETMARDFKTPAYICSALSWRSADDSLCFGAGGGGFGFGGAAGLADAYYDGSGGLVLFR
ncbi:MAG: hypothetical protein WCV59_03640 [Parcubacteria group bacterium]|jgi:hypothetical protein